jgi:hypothetical protein
MYNKEIAIVEKFCEEASKEVPEIEKQLENATLGAATGLEYYGMLKGEIKNILNTFQFSEQTTDMAAKAIRAIDKIYGN